MHLTPVPLFAFVFRREQREEEHRASALKEIARLRDARAQVEAELHSLQVSIDNEQ